MFISSAMMLLLGISAFQPTIGLDIKPELGSDLQDEPLATIAPDGRGLPKATGSVEQGRDVYLEHCVSCHGVSGDTPGNALVGGAGSLNSAVPNKTVGSYWPYATTLFDYVNRAMPYGNEKVLSASEVYSVTAYLLFLNDIVAFDAVMNAKTLPLVLMPNREGFLTDKEFQIK
jgi:hypothetical protein